MPTESLKRRLQKGCDAALSKSPRKATNDRGRQATRAQGPTVLLRAVLLLLARKVWDAGKATLPWRRYAPFSSPCPFLTLSTSLLFCSGDGRPRSFFRFSSFIDSAGTVCLGLAPRRRYFCFCFPS
ncbi:hypothetical protein M440DRAFT_1059358 [Trichoderma longibrachiatum ATCC 18648]|uniref:Uncharacterized protein n=1 Tax=Trichoderma longibrachiatum ATCC 18648 TaxID=983965 RepID=A0A2T4BXY7_TRILO|nr:hypothetical protein M440DRAFT_1059358 [Trichoderma longibrachiatum ATCC 18648]